MKEIGSRLHGLLKKDWSFQMEEFPEEATRLGVPGGDHRWTDLSPAAMERRKRRTQQSLKELVDLPRERLCPADQLNYDLYRVELEMDRAGQAFPDEFLPLSQMEGIQHHIPSTLAVMPLCTEAQGQNILARLAAVPELVNQTLELLQTGVERGLTPPRITLRAVPEQIGRLMAEDGPLLLPFREHGGTLRAACREKLKAQALSLLVEKVRPALLNLQSYLEEAYIPVCRETVGLSALPDGAAWYQHLVRYHTTTSLTPAQIHATGLQEVARIRAAMESVQAQTGFAGSNACFLEFLRSDPRFFFTDAKSLLAAYRDIAKRIDPELIRFFGRLPRLPYGIKAVPAYAQESQTTAYYEPGSMEAGRPGLFFANTYALETRPRWEMEALSLHESVPGHHLQIALAQEQEDLPPFRRHGGCTAFVEGWGLYAESLGAEMGLYADSYSLFGRLTYEMWRAIRLVVDTGLHAMEWSRRQAIDYFEANAGKCGHDIVVEVDRYIVWPGQALAYKLGELKIKALRQAARQALGESFDLRAFHDALLSEGALPLDILEERMQAWTASVAGSEDAGEEHAAP